MGLFSKKTQVCESCGKTYGIRIADGGHLCRKCRDRIAGKEAELFGYVEYARKNFGKFYTEAELDDILRHRTEILERYRIGENGVTTDELYDISSGYKHYNDHQMIDVVNRLMTTRISWNWGAASGARIFAPLAFDGTFVDNRDIFAVGLIKDHKLKIDGHEALLAVMFTNDPYLPVFPAVFINELGIFGLSRNKGRQEIADLLYRYCPNLAYAVMDIKDLCREIEREGSVRGNISVDEMLAWISQARGETGMFNTKRVIRVKKLPSQTAVLLGNYGFIGQDNMDLILGWDRKFVRNRWDKRVAQALAAC